ncbi:aldehyde dehydrogenase, partial [Streptomyces sp. 372A]
MTTPVDGSQNDTDSVLAGLATAEQRWAATDLEQRSRLLDRVGDLVTAHAEEWIAAAARIKELDPHSPLVGEEWISGPWAVTGYVRALARTHDRLARGTDPFRGRRLGTAPGGRVSVPALPANGYDRLLLSGFSA